MPRAFRCLVFGLIIILLGINLYLGYLYFLKSGRLNLATTPSIPTIKLKGQVLWGLDTDVQGSDCPVEYYLVSGNRATWLVSPSASGISNSGAFSKYRYSEVEVTGTNKGEDSLCNAKTIDCGCHNYIAVNNVRVLKDRTAYGHEYQGDIFCLHDVANTELDACYYGLKTADGKTYYLLVTPEARISAEYEGKAKVLGVVNKSAEIPSFKEDIDGVLDVFEIQKI